jgi:type III secretion protein Q
MLPFDLPPVSRGWAELSPGARELGARAAEAAAKSVSALLGHEVTVEGRPVPARSGPRLAAVRLAIELAEVPGAAILELDPGLVAAAVDRLAGGPGHAVPATSLTAIEAAALELLALAALDGACGVAEVEARLCPRLVRAVVEPAGALAVELTLRAGPLAGRARLLVAAAGVRALRDAAAPCAVPSPTVVPVSLRGPVAALTLAELEELVPGDVVVCDPPPGGLHALVLPGGARLAGALEESTFHLEEIRMTSQLAEIPVTLEVELARLDVPLAELVRLEPGAILTLPVDRRGEVTLRLGERRFARGELVDVDGAIGVRVLAREVTP